MDTYKVTLTRATMIDGKPAPAESVVEVGPLTALDLVNGNRGTLVQQATDSQRLRAWATRTGARAGGLF